MNIRPATVADAAQMLEIYRPNIESSVISFETSVPTLAEFEGRVRDTLKNYPWIVYEENQRVLGYAYAGLYRARSAYAWSLESSVYVDNAHHGKGVGKRLYRALLAILKNQGVVNVIGGITLPNESSVRLHETMGFQKVAHFKDVGFKFGKWWDVGFWELQLQRPAEPAALKLPRY